MPSSFQDARVLITGASSGVGRELALQFANEGAQIAIVGRNKAKLEELCSEITRNGGCAFAHPGDLSALQEIPALVTNVQKNFFRAPINILVNAAGVASLGIASDIPLSAYEESFAVNFFAPLALCKQIFGKAKETKSGLVINFTSGAALRGLPGASPYCTSKAALQSLTESLEIEFLPLGVKVMTISPGLMRTGFSERAHLFGKYAEQLNTGSQASPRIIAEKILVDAKRGRTNCSYSIKTTLATHVNYWMPGLLTMIFRKRFLSKLDHDSNEIS
jgi:short-subunit dehydrogenase